MLGDIDAIANLAVKDLPRARKFYENTLDLTPIGSEGDEVVTYRSGGTKLNVYKSKEAGTNKATAVTWTVGDGVEDIVEALAAKGVVFEHYDMPDMRREGNMHLAGDMRVAWFKDPDGNILNLVNR
jgi:catechol 2,3-dioxygenase-like lactoylglutathione lyase family enzyme